MAAFARAHKASSIGAKYALPSEYHASKHRGNLRVPSYRGCILIPYEQLTYAALIDWICLSLGRQPLGIREGVDDLVELPIGRQC